MASSLSNLIDNIAGRFHKINSTYGNDNSKCVKCKTKYKDCEYYVEYTNIKDGVLIYRYFFCNRNY